MKSTKNSTNLAETSDQNKKAGDEVTAQDPYSFIVTALYFGYGFIVGTSISPYAPISSCFKIAYDLDQSDIILSSAFFVIGKIIFSSFAGVVLNRIGLRYGILMSLLVFGLGLTLRLSIYVSWYLVLLGQLICGAAATLIIASQMQFCQAWFPSKIRGFYVTVTSMSMITGGAFSLIYCLFFVKEDEKNQSIIENGVRQFNLTNCIVISILIILHFLFFKNKPRSKYTTSVSQIIDLKMASSVHEEDSESKNENLLDQSSELRLLTKSKVNGLKEENWKVAYIDNIKTLASQRMFRISVCIYLMLTCANITFTTNINYLFKDAGYLAKDAAICVVFYIVGGFIGCSVFFKFLMNSPNSIKYYTGFFACGLGSLMLMASILNSHQPTEILFFIAFIFGFFTMVGVPVCLEIMIRTVKGVPFNFVNGIIYFLAQIASTIALLIISGFFKSFGSSTGCFSVIVLMCFVYGSCIGVATRIQL
jgi:MFS family permease